MGVLDIRAVGSPAASKTVQGVDLVVHQAEVMGCRMVGTRGKVTDTTIVTSSDHGIEDWNPFITPQFLAALFCFPPLPFIIMLILQIVNPWLTSRMEW